VASCSRVGTTACAFEYATLRSLASNANQASIDKVVSTLPLTPPQDDRVKQTQPKSDRDRERGEWWEEGVRAIDCRQRRCKRNQNATQNATANVNFPPSAESKLCTAYSGTEKFQSLELFIPFFICFIYLCLTYSQQL